MQNGEHVRRCPTIGIDTDLLGRDITVLFNSLVELLSVVTEEAVVTERLYVRPFVLC
jgi:hypothetical protein